MYTFLITIKHWNIEPVKPFKEIHWPVLPSSQKLSSFIIRNTQDKRGEIISICSSRAAAHISRAAGERLRQWEEMETDCIFPSPSSLSQQAHLSTPSWMMLLEDRVSSRERDKRRKKAEQENTRAGWKLKANVMNQELSADGGRIYSKPVWV